MDGGRLSIVGKILDYLREGFGFLKGEGIFRN
jgi:hypothetical protein